MWSSASWTRASSHDAIAPVPRERIDGAHVATARAGAMEPEPHAIPELVSRLGSGEPAPVDLGPERLGRAVQKALTGATSPTSAA